MNFLNDETLNAATDLTAFSKKDLNFLLGIEGEKRYDQTALKNVTQKNMADELHQLLLEHRPIKKGKTVTEKTPRPAFIPRDSKNVACAASAKTNLIKAVIAGKKTIELALQIVAGNPTLTAYWGETVEQDLRNALVGIRPAQVRSEAAAARKAERETARANKAAEKAAKTTVVVDLETGEFEVAA